jgi:hypothetical protein
MEIINAFIPQKDTNDFARRRAIAWKVEKKIFILNFTSLGSIIPINPANIVSHYPATMEPNNQWKCNAIFHLCKLADKGWQYFLYFSGSETQACEYCCYTGLNNKVSTSVLCGFSLQESRMILYGCCSQMIWRHWYQTGTAARVVWVWHSLSTED